VFRGNDLSPNFFPFPGIKSPPPWLRPRRVWLINSSTSAQLGGLSKRRRDDVSDRRRDTNERRRSPEHNYDDGTGDGTAHKCVEGGRRIWRVIRTTGQPDRQSGTVVDLRRRWQATGQQAMITALGHGPRYAYRGPCLGMTVSTANGAVRRVRNVIKWIIKDALNKRAWVCTQLFLVHRWRRASSWAELGLLLISCRYHYVQLYLPESIPVLIF